MLQYPHNRTSIRLGEGLLVLLALLVLALPWASRATSIDEVLVPPAMAGNDYSGTFLITPSTPTWAFGVGSDDFSDASISGIAFIDGLDAGDHWIYSFISRATWMAGFSFENIRPIGATGPSSFFVDTSSIAWQWGSFDTVLFYWLYEAGDDAANPQAVLQTGTQYDAFKFFTSNPASPFAAFGAADGGSITTGETVVTIVPEPSTALLLAAGLVGLARSRRQRWC